jgi:hypothetical protein
MAVLAMAIMIIIVHICINPVEDWEADVFVGIILTSQKSQLLLSEGLVSPAKA